MKDFYLFLKCLSFNTYCSFQKNQDVKRRSSSTKFAVGLVVIYTSMSTAGAKFIVGVIDSRMDSFFHHVLLEGGDSDFLPECRGEWGDWLTFFSLSSHSPIFQRI
jgi:hypothetical protein